MCSTATTWIITKKSPVYRILGETKIYPTCEYNDKSHTTTVTENVDQILNHKIVKKNDNHDTRMVDKKVSQGKGRKTLTSLNETLKI